MLPWISFRGTQITVKEVKSKKEKEKNKFREAGDEIGIPLFVYSWRIFPAYNTLGAFQYQYMIFTRGQASAADKAECIPALFDVLGEIREVKEEEEDEEENNGEES